MSPPARRIAVVSHSAWMGGAERCLLELVAAVAATPGREVSAVLPDDGPLRAALEDAGAPVTVAAARWWARDPAEGPPRPDPRGAVRTARALRRLRPDVVLSNTLVHPPGALAAAALRLPHLWWVHEFGDRDHGFRFLLGARATRRALGALSRAVLHSSDAVGRTLAPHVPAARLRRLDYPGPPRDATCPAPRAPGPARLAIVGRVRPSKGQADAVRAVARLARAGVPVQLDVVGDGSPGDVAGLRRLAGQLGVADRVHLHGPSDDPRAFFDRADVALMCSRDEAFGRVTAEAMVRGRAVVGAASGGTPELIRHGETGLLYRPGDDAGLAAAVAALVRDPGRRRALGRAARADVLARFQPHLLGPRFLAIADAAATA